MALAVNVRFDLIDNKGKTSFTKIRVPTGFSIAQYIEFAQGAAQVIANTSNCKITSVSLTFGIDLTGLGLATVASGLADIYQKFRFQFNTAISGFKAKFQIPASSESLVTSGSDAVNIADVDVAAFIAAMNNGIVVTGGTVAFADNRGMDITSLQFAREVHRRKG